MYSWQSNDPNRFLVYLLISMFGSGMKVVLPGVDGTMSANFLFVLIAIAEFTLPETVAISCVGIVIQSLWHTRKRPKILHLSFNVASIALAAAGAFLACHYPGLQQRMDAPVSLLLAAAVFFAGNTFLIAGAIAVTEWQPVWKLWRENYFWSFPAYLVGAAAAALIQALSHWIGWQTALLILPVMYVIHNSHRLYVEKLDSARRHAERERQHAVDKAAIQLRTIEALALAIEAKDGTTYEHLERVQVYAIEVGKELALSDNDLEALRAAAILHDVGKIAVPEYIISKPGKLTPGEFDKMKIHPVVGAQICEQVQFPYPVAPIVRAHHEKWDGTGYPDGLAGEQIPIGARILTAVDVLDALASDRQYRKALPLSDAIAVLRRDAGKMFDPRVVEVLSRRYVELEQMARERIRLCRPVIQTDVKVERGAAPDAGFESASGPKANSLRRLHSSLVANGNVSVQLDACSDLARRIESNIAFDALGVFLEENDTLRTVYCEGPFADAIRHLEVASGKGLIGWVAENHMPILNGNPGVEPGIIERPGGKELSSALAIPVESAHGSMIVVCLYLRERDGFDREHLKLLQSLCTGPHCQILTEATP